MPPPKNAIPEWLQLVMDHEAKCRTPKRLLQNEGRKAMWVFSSLMQVSSLGIPGQACRLLERYLSERYREAEPVLHSTEGKKRFFAELSSQILLVMATCIQLASKMASTALALSSKFTRYYLASQDIHFSISEINQMEITIYQILDYRIPKYTSVELAQLLAREIELPMAIMKDIGLLTDLVEYNRDKVDRIVRQTFKRHNSGSSSLTTLHLAAGSAAAVAKQLPDFTDTSVTRLAGLTKAPIGYIECVIKVILTFALPLPSSEGVIQKRIKIN